MDFRQLYVELCRFTRPVKLANAGQEEESNAYLRCRWQNIPPPYAMNIAPVTSRSREISVTEPLSLAYGRVKLVLFQPFDAGKWLVIGFCAWLAQLGQGGGGGGGGYNFGNRTFGNHDAHPWEQVHHGLAMAHEYVLANLAWLVPVASLAVLLILGLGVLMIWLSSCGKFMFLHCVAENRAQIEIPWNKYGGVAIRLFLFRLMLTVAGLVLILPPVALIIILIVRMFQAGDASLPLVIGAVGLGLVVALLGVVLGLVTKMTNDFVVPILYLRGGGCRAAWGEFLQLLRAHPGSFVLYILVQILLAVVLGIILFWLVLMTCCTLGCLLAIPFLGTVLLLPLLVFKQAYAVHFLAQFGPDYDVFPPAAPPVPTPPPGLQPL